MGTNANKLGPTALAGAHSASNRNKGISSKKSFPNSKFLEDHLTLFQLPNALSRLSLTKT